MRASSYQTPEPALGDPALRSPFSADLSTVRAHVGAEPPSLGAQAFTQGAAPALGALGAPELVPHEAVHVVQQRGLAQTRANLFGDQY